MGCFLGFVVAVVVVTVLMGFGFVWGGNTSLALSQYRWNGVVKNQIPDVDKKCLESFQLCFYHRYSFEELLYDHQDERRRLCQNKNIHLKCLVNPALSLDGCSKWAVNKIETFVCYNYNTSDDTIPPISATCARRAWRCSNLTQGFLGSPSVVENKPRLCEKRNEYGKCYLLVDDYYNYCLAPDVNSIHRFVCGDDSRSAPIIDRWCEDRVLSCIEKDVLDVFKVLVDVYTKQDNEQVLGCDINNMVSCLTPRDGMGLECRPQEAVAVHEFLCSTPPYTPPPQYGLSTISDACTNTFNYCFKYRLSSLVTKTKTRRYLCRERYRSLATCMFLPNCTWHEKSRIGHFLCFDRDNPILNVSDTCRDRFKNCYGVYEDFSRLEYSRTNSKVSLCRREEFQRTCMESSSVVGVPCHRDEMDIIHTFLCGEATAIRLEDQPDSGGHIIAIKNEMFVLSLFLPLLLRPL